jgi:methanogenic corrinoid protein MtbC1
MQAHLAGGLAAAQAARAVIAEDQPGGSSNPVAIKGAGRGAGTYGDTGAGKGGAAAPRTERVDSADLLRQALDDLDEPAAQALLDRLLTDLTVETVLRDVVMPYLQDLGRRWQDGAVSIAQEHFASHVIRGRLAGLARGWGNGRGPKALLACPPDELHELALLVFGIVLNRGGWRIEYLGANTPMPDTIQVTAQIRPNLVVLAATRPERFAAIIPDLRRLAGTAPVALAGAGASTELAQSIGARLLTGDPVTAAEDLAGS